MHKRLIEPALQQLDDKGAVYFHDLARKLEFDPRTERFANLVYLVLREAIPLLPTILDPKVLIDDLFVFVDENRVAIEHRIHSPRFVVDPGFLRPMVLLYVKMISDRCWERMEEGDITIEGDDVYRLSWPYEGEPDFPYKGDDEDDGDELITDMEQLTEILLSARTGGGEK